MFQREKGDYLLDTIYSLQNNLGVARNKIAIVVYIGEIERDYIFSRTDQIVRKFPELVSSGFLQVLPTLRFLQILALFNYCITAAKMSMSNLNSI